VFTDREKKKKKKKKRAKRGETQKGADWAGGKGTFVGGPVSPRAFEQEKVEAQEL